MLYVSRESFVFVSFPISELFCRYIIDISVVSPAILLPIKLPISSVFLFFILNYYF